MALTKEEILIYNPLIAKFMGARVVQAYSDYEGLSGLMFYFDKDLSPVMRKNLSMSEIKYHSSFEWLMPVCKKIIPPTGWPLDGIKHQTAVMTTLQYLDLETIYRTVVDFIKWYNKEQENSL